jgi:hypothetical protein
VTDLPVGREERPVEHRGFIEQMEHYHVSYARALLHIERSERIVAEAFDILWAGWDEAEASAGPTSPATPGGCCAPGSCSG